MRADESFAHEPDVSSAGTGPTRPIVVCVDCDKRGRHFDGICDDCYRAEEQRAHEIYVNQCTYPSSAGIRGCQ